MQNPVHLTALITLACDQQSEVRGIAVDALGHWGCAYPNDSQIRKAVHALLQDPGIRIAERIAEALDCGDAAVLLPPDLTSKTLVRTELLRHDTDTGPQRTGSAGKCAVLDSLANVDLWNRARWTSERGSSNR